jgi:hypothetical protein
MPVRNGNLSQEIDIQGSLNVSNTRTLTDESNALGAQISTGTGDTIGGTAPTMTLTDAGAVFTAQDVGRFITLSGATTPANDGTFMIVGFTSGTVISYNNASGVAEAFAGTWTITKPYSIEDDINFARTDRRNIKGTASHITDVPTYQRPTAVGTNVAANLTNIAGKTTDAKALVVNRKFAGATVAATDTSDTITDVGNLKHADATDRTGVPIQDGADAGAHLATYVEIINPATEAALEVLAGPDIGKRVFGRTRAGASTSPNSVEIEFRAVTKGADLSTSVAYTWESGQPTTVDYYYGFRERLDNLTETALRTVLTNGLVADADMSQDISDIRTAIGIADGATSLNGLLTNTGNFYVFASADATPTVVELFNLLNAQIGNRDYTGSILTDGQTITASLQALSDAISGSTFVRTIERLTSDNSANVARTIPGAQTYTLDGSNNGQNMTLFWTKLLRDPGPVVDNNDYAETSTTSFTPYTKIKNGDHINYYIYA